MTTAHIILIIGHSLFLAYAIYCSIKAFRKYKERKNNKIQNKSFYDRLKEEEAKEDPEVFRHQVMNDLVLNKLPEGYFYKNGVLAHDMALREEATAKIESANLDHVSIGINGIGLGLSNIEYKHHAQDPVEMLKYLADDDLKINADFEEQSNIESNASDSSSVDYGGGDSGGSGSGNDY